MANENENKKVEFHSQMNAERDFYLGKLSDDDKVPGSEMTIKEAKEDFEKRSKAFEQEKYVRQQAVLAEQENAVQTTLVVPGVLVDLKMPKTERILTGDMEKNLVDGNGLIPLPDDEVLNGMNVGDLITLAGNRKIEVKANVDTKPTIIKKLKGTFISNEDASSVSLSGKSRLQLEEIGTVVGVKDTGNKELFPNIESLSEAIETSRKKMTI